MEITAIKLRHTREPPKRGLAKVLAKSKEQAKTVFVEHKDRVIVKHANGTEQSFEGVKSQDFVKVTISSPWYADSHFHCASRSRTPIKFRSDRAG